MITHEVIEKYGYTDISSHELDEALFAIDTFHKYENTNSIEEIDLISAIDGYSDCFELFSKNALILKKILVKLNKLNKRINVDYLNPDDFNVTHFGCEVNTAFNWFNGNLSHLVIADQKLKPRYKEYLELKSQVDPIIKIVFNVSDALSYIRKDLSQSNIFAEFDTIMTNIST